MGGKTQETSTSSLPFVWATWLQGLPSTYTFISHSTRTYGGSRWEEAFGPLNAVHKGVRGRESVSCQCKGGQTSSKQKTGGIACCTLALAAPKAAPVRVIVSPPSLKQLLVVPRSAPYEFNRSRKREQGRDKEGASHQSAQIDLKEGINALEKTETETKKQ